MVALKPDVEPSVKASTVRGAVSLDLSRTRQVTDSPRWRAWSTASDPVPPEAPKTAIEAWTSDVRVKLVARVADIKKADTGDRSRAAAQRWEATMWRMSRRRRSMAKKKW